MWRTRGDSNSVGAVGNGPSSKEDVDGVKSFLHRCVVHIPQLWVFLVDHGSHSLLSAMRVQDGNIHHSHATVCNNMLFDQENISILTSYH